MSLLIKIILLFVTLTVTVIPALAVTEGRSLQTDFLVWIFLGCCALIIVAQVVPMILDLRKQAKLAAAQKKVSAQNQS
jgi:hypothetical protein